MKKQILKNKLKEYRIRKGYSQEYLAKISNTTQNTISSIENYTYYPRLFTALHISRALECNVEDIFYL